ncbi:MAG: M14 family zinc carboxypeptidase [Myxococcota bacterium]
MLPLFFLGCQPVVVNTASEIPTRLYFWDCPSGSHLQNSEVGQSCKSKSGEREGPQLIRSSEQTLYSVYHQDQLVELPWVLDSENNPIETQTYNYIAEEDSIPLLQGFLNRFPESDKKINVRVRLAALGALSADEIFAESGYPKHCRFVPDGMKCIRADSVAIALRDAGQKDVHYRAFQHPTYAINEHSMGWDELIECQEQCNCDPALSFWAQAEQYCTSNGLYLPSEWQYWAALDEIDFSEVELTRERWMPAEPRTVKIQPMEYLHDPQYSSQPLQIAPQQRLRGGDDTDLRFRCAGTIPQLQIQWEQEQLQYPIRLDTLPPMPRVTSGGSSDSWWSTDLLYRKYFDKGPRIVDGKVVQDYIYQDFHSLAELLWAYHLQQRAITSVYLLGNSHQGRPILALRISDSPQEIKPKPSVLLFGGLHGNELMGTLYAIDLLHYTLSRHDFDPQVQSWVSKLDIWIVPMLNPDGNWTFLRHDQGWTRGRKNGRNTDGRCEFHKTEGVDLSRNFPFFWGEGGPSSSDSHSRLPYYRGPEAASEPETQALIHLADLMRFSAAISYHTPGTEVMAPYLHRDLKSPVPQKAQFLAIDLIEQTKVQTNGRSFQIKSGTSKMAGNDVDWLFHKYGTLAYLVEGSHHNPLKVRYRMESIEGVRPIGIALLDRIASGPSVYGQVVDGAGNPIWTTLYESGQVLHENETWTNRPIDGFFYRISEPRTAIQLYLNEPNGRLTETVTVGRKPQLLHWIVNSSVARP